MVSQRKLVSGLGAKETEISAAVWALRLGKDFTFLRTSEEYKDSVNTW